jgi:antitoxin component HigA of HigAB toxin-antitoxin module
MAKLYFELGEIALSHYQLAKAAENEEDYKQALTQLEIVMSKDPTKRTSYEKLKNEWTEKLKEGRATK